MKNPISRIINKEMAWWVKRDRSTPIYLRMLSHAEVDKYVEEELLQQTRAYDQHGKGHLTRVAEGKKLLHKG